MILDPVGAGYLADNLSVLGLDGRLVIIGLMGGAEASVNLGLMMVKRQRIIGSTLRARSVAAKAAVMDALSSGSLAAHRKRRGSNQSLTRCFPSARRSGPTQLVAADQTFGKVVLTVGG